MIYKRTEYFRYTFGEPLDAKFRIVIANNNGKESGLGTCSMIDLSPSGAKLFANYDIPLKSEPVKIHLAFTLNEVMIEVWGTLVWKKTYMGGYLYGFDSEEDEETEALIVNELKLRRRLDTD